MMVKRNILTDSFGREHNYLRISLTEKCNLRCTYCMPLEGVPLTPKSHLMTTHEIVEIASRFVAAGVTKIRLTGGEPLIRKDFNDIIQQLSALNVQLSLTTNGILIDRYIDELKKCSVSAINVSLDTLSLEKFSQITKRNQFQKVIENLKLLYNEGFNVKLNIVLIKGFNDNEIADFIELTKKGNLTIRFIEFMPFDGNKWKKENMVSLQEILSVVKNHFGESSIQRLTDEKNDTTKNYKIKGFKGTFGVISSVTNPFCDTCNRIRLTADGKLKNCLFSGNETDLLTTFRSGQPIEPIIEQVLKQKFKMRGGMDSFEKLQNPDFHQQNRSMITIGG